jgi:DNA-directed RNA polymerase sigma subunit (sigma70/sigma32)
MRLTYIESAVIRLRLGIDDEIERTYEEIASILKFSKTMIKHIEKRAIRKLQHPRNKKVFEDIKDSIYAMENERVYMQSISTSLKDKA